MDQGDAEAVPAQMSGPTFARVAAGGASRGRAAARGRIFTRGGSTRNLARGVGSSSGLAGAVAVPAANNVVVPVVVNNASTRSAAAGDVRSVATGSQQGAEGGPVNTAVAATRTTTLRRSSRVESGQVTGANSQSSK